MRQVRAAEALLDHSPALVDAAGLAAFVARHQPVQRIAELLLTCHAVAPDELAGRAVTISEGDLRTIALASAAVPGVLRRSWSMGGDWWTAGVSRTR